MIYEDVRNTLRVVISKGRAIALGKLLGAFGILMWALFENGYLSESQVKHILQEMEK